uniref:Cylicin 1 n=1 Tax=Pipistrellus kuhlii TaxID=59472 RepID=A0A7J7V604_PIPKU|nr:cylicin 1 [Pipistrellus kuhlii]
MSLLRLQAVNIKPYDKSMPIRESRRKLWNQESFTLTFSKPPQPGRKKISRPSELQITVPRYDKRKLEEVCKPAHTWIWHFLRKNFQRPSNYFTLRQQAPFRHPYTLKAHPKNFKDNSKKITFKKNSKKNTHPYETTIESKETGNDKKSKIANKEDKTPSKSLHASELSKKSKYKSGINPKSKNYQKVLIHPKNSRTFKNSKDTDIEPICTKKDSKSSKNNFNAKSEACSKNNSNMNLMLYLEESGAESMEFDMWLKNYSHNNSKKPAKKDSKKSSDAESGDSKDAKKDKKKKGDKKKKKNAKDTESTEAESGSGLESKKGKKDLKKGKKPSKKDDKKKDIKKEVLSTDDDPESESISKKGEKDEKNKKELKKSEKKKPAMKSEKSSETESDWESKKDKRDSKKATKMPKKYSKRKDAMKNIDSTDTESDVSLKKATKKPVISKSSGTESEESMYKAGSKKKFVYESDATSTDSKKEALERKRNVKMSFRRSSFKGRGKSTIIGRVPPSRESSLPSPCEPLHLSPKIKHICRCKLDPPKPKPRYAPLPEAKWIHKLL